MTSTELRANFMPVKYLFLSLICWQHRVLRSQQTQEPTLWGSLKQAKSIGSWSRQPESARLATGIRGWHSFLRLGWAVGGETGSTQYLRLSRRNHSLLWDRALPGSVCPTLPWSGTQNCKNKSQSLNVKRTVGAQSNSLRRREDGEKIVTEH